ncbi:MAG: hypothetical protein ACJ77G_08915 [Solirubrobacteraceae bacterium]
MGRWSEGEREPHPASLVVALGACLGSQRHLDVFAGPPAAASIRSSATGSACAGAVSSRQATDAERAARVERDEEAQRLRFLGSPTVRVDGRDVEPGADVREDFGLKCRLYRTEDGLTGTPAEEWLVAAIRADPACASEDPEAGRCFAAPMPSRTIISNARVTLERTTSLDSGRRARLRVSARARPACTADAGRPRRRREGASFLVL